MIDNELITDEEIEKQLLRNARNIHGETDGIFIFRHDEISEIKKPRVESLKTRSSGNNNIAYPGSEIKQNINFQTVYHGSGANFERFNTDEYGLSGEGSMSFGYGTYLTDDEEIARSYANRQSYMNDTYKLKSEYNDWDSIVYDVLLYAKLPRRCGRPLYNNLKL